MKSNKGYLTKFPFFVLVCLMTATVTAQAAAAYQAPVYLPDGATVELPPDTGAKPAPMTLLSFVVAS